MCVTDKCEPGSAVEVELTVKERERVMQELVRWRGVSVCTSELTIAVMCIVMWEDAQRKIFRVTKATHHNSRMQIAVFFLDRPAKANTINEKR